MKRLLILLVSLALILLPIGTPMYRASAQQVATPMPEQSAHPPPVAQPLIREGDFAVRLVSALNLSRTSNEAEAESILSRAGIAPSNGWIADYPVTPDVVDELLGGVQTAAASGRIALSEADAVSAFDGVSAGFGLAVAPAPGETQTATTSAPPPDNTLYTSPTTVNNYYYQYGPPVVTYYAPPPEYTYLYAWVPFPFFSLGFWFPGYYCLHDFDRVIVVGHVNRIISNHWYDPHSHGYVLVRPPYWYGHGRYHHERFVTPTHGFADRHADRHAEAILRGHASRESYRGEMHRGVRGPEGFGPRNPQVARGGPTPHFRGPEGRSGQARPPSRMGPSSYNGGRHATPLRYGRNGNEAAHGRSAVAPRSPRNGATWGSSNGASAPPGHVRSFGSERGFNRPSASEHGSFRGGLASTHVRSFSSERHFSRPTFSARRSSGGGPAPSHLRSYSSGRHFSRPSVSAHRSFGGTRFSRR